MGAGQGEGISPHPHTNKATRDVVSWGMNTTPDSRQAALVAGIAVRCPLQRHVHRGPLLKYEELVPLDLKAAEPTREVRASLPDSRARGIRRTKKEIRCHQMMRETGLLAIVDIANERWIFPSRRIAVRGRSSPCERRSTHPYRESGHDLGSST